MSRAVEAVESRIEKLMEPFHVELDLLKTIPGVKAATAHTLLAEIGPDMSRFPPRPTWSPGLVSVPVTTRAPASEDPRASAEALAG